MTDYSGLFGWWISSITFNIIFVIAASVYLYRRRKRPETPPTKGIVRVAKDFAFVWILIGLLVLYVVSVGQGSYPIFAIGNIVVEIILIVYVVRSGKSSQQTVSSASNQPTGPNS